MTARWLQLAFLLVAVPAYAQNDAELQHCATTADPTGRLGCYDKLAKARAYQPPALGMIQICRTPGVVGTHQEDSIDIPTGASVVDFGEKSSLVAGGNGIVELATIHSAVLMHGQACVKIQARIKTNPRHRQIVASPTLNFRPQGSSGKPDDRWVFLADYRITVVEDFK